MFGKKENDFVYFGEQRVDIPKLVIGKWKILFENIETLPQLIANILASRGSDEFTVKLVLGTTMAIEELVTLVAAITELEEEFIYDNADHNDLIAFITKTIKKNNLNDFAKKLQALFAKANNLEAAGKPNVL